MFVLCPHCQFLVGVDPGSGQPPARCPRCRGLLLPASATTAPTDLPAAVAALVPTTEVAADAAGLAAPWHDTAPVDDDATAAAAPAAVAEPPLPPPAQPVAPPLEDVAISSTPSAELERAATQADTVAVAAGAAGAAALPAIEDADADATSTAQLAPEPASIEPAPIEPASIESASIDAAATGDGEPDASAGTSAASPPSAAAALTAPSPRRHWFANRIVRRPGPAPATMAAIRRWRAPVAIAALTLLLALQMLLADRAQLAADAQWRPWLQGLCGALGCELPPWREPQAITVLDRNVGPDPQRPGVLQVHARLRNDARWTQPWPALSLTLSDADGRTVGARVFTPREYLAAGTTQHGVASGQVATVSMEVIEPGPGVVAFTFDFR